MTTEECDWLNHSDIDRWAKEWKEDPSHRFLDFDGKHDPIDELKHRLNRGDFSGKKKASVESYISQHEKLRYRVSEHARADREERAVVAAEKSARWAGVAIVISVAALAVSALPYMLG